MFDYAEVLALSVLVTTWKELSLVTADRGGGHSLNLTSLITKVIEKRALKTGLVKVHEFDVSIFM